MITANPREIDEIKSPQTMEFRDTLTLPLVPAGFEELAAPPDGAELDPPVAPAVAVAVAAS